MPSRLVRRALLAGVALSVVTFTVPAAAYAASAGNSPAKIAAAHGLNRTNSRTPVTYLAARGARSGEATPNVTASGGHISGNKNYYICPHNGSCADMNDNFYSSTTGQYCVDACLKVQYHVTNGTSYVYWFGSSPVNASEMAEVNDVWVGGVGVAVSVAGATGSTGNITNGKEFSYSYSNTWRLEIAFNSMYFTTALEEWGPYESETGTADFTWQQFNDVIS